VAGFGVLALGIACWSGPPLLGMLLYSASVTFYLARLDYTVGLTGILVRPVVVFHAILTAFLSWTYARAKAANGKKNESHER
jgi:hypothetical protein